MSFNVFKLILLVLAGVVTILVLLQGGRTDGFMLTNYSRANMSLFDTRKTMKFETYLEVATGIVIAVIMVIAKFAF